MNQKFFKDGELKVRDFGRVFAWSDAYVRYRFPAEVSTFVEVIEKRLFLKVACQEDIAYRNGWVNEECMLEIAKPMMKN